ncbi:MAG: VOC family protein [Pseudomonadota bacterium]
MNLNQVTLGVTDIASGIAFYEDIGLRLIVHTHDGYARFEMPGGEGSTFSLHKVDRVAPSTTLVYFETDEIEAAVDRAVAAGATLNSPAKDESWLWREARLTDPFGNPLCFYHAGENRRFPPWRKEGGA